MASCPWLNNTLPLLWGNILPRDARTSCLTPPVRDPGRDRVLERKEELFYGPKRAPFFS